MPTTITGHIIDRQTHRGVAGLRVESWDREQYLNALIGNAGTDVKGIFSIELDRPSLETILLGGQTELFFKGFRGDDLISSAEASLVWRADDLFEIAIEVDELHHDEVMLTETEHVQTDEEQERYRTQAKQPQETWDPPISDLAKAFQVKLPRTLNTYFTGALDHHAGRYPRYRAFRASHRRIRRYASWRRMSSGHCNRKVRQ